MPDQQLPIFPRRRFLCDVGLAAGGMACGLPAAAALAAEAAAIEPAPASGRWPCRTLGRTDLKPTCFTLGSAPCGIARDVSVAEVADIVNLAIDLGVNSIDTAPKYGKAEEGIGRALGKRRKQVYLATKVGADSVADAEASLAKSLERLKTDYVDVLYFHHLGDRDVARARDADGVFTWLLQQKKAGKCRFVGISGHDRPGRFPAFLASGEVDVLLTVVNFVDRFTYQFEEKVLPLARKHNVGIVAMKVFGGPDPKTGSWNTVKAKPMIEQQHLELAVRYALSTPGVATANLGVHTAAQLRQNVEFVQRFRPLDPKEQQRLTQLGRPLADAWGPHFGPVNG